MRDREEARYMMSTDREALAADLGVDGISAWGRLYDRVSGALRITVMEQGELVERSPGQIQFDSADLNNDNVLDILDIVTMVNMIMGT